MMIRLEWMSFTSKLKQIQPASAACAESHFSGWTCLAHDAHESVKQISCNELNRAGDRFAGY
jgi:hypothetical protein